MTKPIDQQEALDQLFEANMKLAKEMTKKYGELQGVGLSLDGKHAPNSDAHVVQSDATIVPDRKLRDALIMADATPGVTIKHDPDAANTGEAISTQEMKKRSVEFWMNMDGEPMAASPQPRQSFIRLIGSIAWRLLVVMVVVGVTVVVLAGGRG